MLRHLLDSQKLIELQQALQSGESILIEELWDAPKACVAALAQQCTGKHVLILTGASTEENTLYHDFPLFTERPVVDYPAWETLPTENVPPSPDVVGDRYQVLHQIKTAQEPQIIISNLHACLQKLIPPSLFETLFVTLRVGQLFSFEVLQEQLLKMGYVRQSVAADKGEFAVRGGIIDVFPVSTPDPYRIEFWGDEIESIRMYDPIGQKSVKQVDEMALVPGQEMELVKKEKHLSSILDYLGPNTLVIFDDLLALEDRYSSLVSICGQPTRAFMPIEHLLDQAQSLQTLYFSQQPIEHLSHVSLSQEKSGGYYSKAAPIRPIAFEMFQRDLSAQRWVSPFLALSEYLVPEYVEEGSVRADELVQSLEKLTETDVHLHVIYQTEMEETAFQKRLVASEVTLPKNACNHMGYLSSGFVLDDSYHVLFPMTELTQRYKIRRQKQRSTYHTVPSQFLDLSPGEMVVHLNNGIGKFLGIKKRPDYSGVLTEFLHLEYANNSQLFVPLHQSHLVTKYIGAKEDKPRLHVLGAARWKKTRENTEQQILGYANELLDVYAKREIKGGFACPVDSPDTVAFEEDFPFVETEDQLNAIRNIKEDMHLAKCMDRLICGDVGYGKTEVAMRAAFKAVVDGQKQVALLVPTTVLALQHYETFLERMGNFPINVAALSRFRSHKETQEILKQVTQGSIDILIGTHRIISKDVVFKDLGLVIIDEEQRFGVKAKEHLKGIKAGVDVLTLSATPIPRTLYMSLINVRDMSVINTPPQDRLPITTHITESDDTIIRNAILRELQRDGQVFFIHNRVETIFEVASRIKKLLPKARVVVGHGQMSAEEIDLVFHKFKSGEADILVSTTIVENGIDIPNANTILIDRADQFGLADLYQLRGRVGRWNRRAYAYFLTPPRRILPEITKKRLSAIAEASGYGGGMKIAMRDLEIRGAGDILGMEQSGHVSAIGFHFYCKLLKRAIQALQGKISTTLCDTRIEIPIDARLPEDYVNETSLRMEIYQRFGEALSWEEVTEIWNELKDRFGPPPEPALWLYHLSRIRVYCSLHGITFLKMEKVSLTIEIKRGKTSQTRKTLVGKYTSPQELEGKVIPLIKKELHAL